MSAKTWLMRNDRWIPSLIVAGFVVMITVNGIMIWLALSTWSGLTTDKAYTQGLAYDETLADADASAALGWSIDVSIDDVGEGEIAQMVITAADGAPVDGAAIKGVFVRPTHEGYDFNVAFRQVSAGRYIAEFVAPLAG
jgi:nitrogen fixation protein FixH